MPLRKNESPILIDSLGCHDQPQMGTDKLEREILTTNFHELARKIKKHPNKSSLEVKQCPYYIKN